MVSLQQYARNTIADDDDDEDDGDDSKRWSQPNNTLNRTIAGDDDNDGNSWLQCNGAR